MSGNENAVGEQKKLELLAKIPFFQNFPSEDKEVLAKIGYLERVKAGQFVIEQGSINLTLRFLINGSLRVVLDGEEIASFKGGGQVFGEMSLVTHELASASIEAVSDAALFSLDYEEISKLKDPIHYRLRMCLYRSCAEVLAKRLKATNETAKFYSD